MNNPTPPVWADSAFVVEVIDMDREMELAEKRLAAYFARIGPPEAAPPAPEKWPELAVAA